MFRFGPVQISPSSKSAAGVSAGVLKVPAQFPTIQQAVAAAAAGDTVVVAPGQYDELVELDGLTDVTLRGRKATLLGDAPSWTVVERGALGVDTLLVVDREPCLQE